MRKGEILGKIFGTALVFVMIVVVCLGAVAAQPVAGTTEASDPPCTCGDICVNTTGWWPAGGTFNASSTPIQSAVNNATGGDTICVKDGTYHENVDVNKTLTIQSENGAANCVVNAANSNDHVFSVTADWVNITGFTVGNATGSSKAGIYLNGAEHCNISSNNATNNDYGIILIISCDYNTLTNNIVSNNDYGIWVVDGSSNNTLTNNIVSNNSYGVYLWSVVHVVNHCNIFGNNLTNNDYGIYLNSSSNNTIYNNYFDNTNNAWDDGNNTWNTTKQAGTNIIGGPYLGGNYWSDYSGNDTDGDGLGNTEIPHNCTGNITNGGDYLPLVVWTGATLEGHAWETPIVVRFFDNSSKAEMDWSPINVITDDHGNFTITGVTPGIYDIGIKNWTCLSRVVTNVTLTAGNTTVVDFGTTYEGDANNDDWIDIEDYSLLIASYDTCPGAANWNPNCDFNRNGWVELGDYIIFLLNWGFSGDLASGVWQPAGEGWGFEIQPNMTEVGLGENFTVNVTAVHYSGAADCWAMYLLFNTTYLEVTGIDTPSTLPGGEAPKIVNTTWSNTTGWAQHAYGIQLGSTNYIHETFVYCTIHFRARSVNGTSHLNFTTIDPANATKSVWIGTDHLNWSYVVNGTVEVVPPTLDGHVNLQGRPSPPHQQWVVDLTVKFRNSTTKVEEAWSPVNVTTDEYGNFSYAGIPNGTYDIGVKANTTLSRLKSGVVVAGTTPVDFGTLLGGDVNNWPDWIDIDDYIYTVDAFDSIPSDGNWNATCDFNLNSWIDIDDYIVLVDNFDDLGEW